MNWYGIFMVLFTTHLIAIVLASVAGYEYRVDQKLRRAKSQHPSMQDSGGQNTQQRRNYEG
jgi:hypothetical protein